MRTTKKLASLLLAVTLVLSAAVGAIPVQAEGGAEEEGFTWGSTSWRNYTDPEKKNINFENFRAAFAVTVADDSKVAVSSVSEPEPPEYTEPGATDANGTLKIGQVVTLAEDVREITFDIENVETQEHRNFVLDNWYDGAVTADEKATLSFALGCGGDFNYTFVGDNSVNTGDTIQVKATLKDNVGTGKKTGVLLLMEQDARVGWSITITANISKEKLTLTPENATKAYDEALTAENVTLKGSNGERYTAQEVNLTVESDALDACSEDAGTYELTVKGEPTLADYDVELASTTATLTVKPATPVLDAENSTFTLVAGEPLSAKEYNAIFKNQQGEEVPGNFTWQHGEYCYSYLGWVTAWYTFTPDDDNYTTVEGTAKVTVVASADMEPSEDELQKLANAEITYPTQYDPPVDLEKVRVEYRPQGNADEDAWTETVPRDAGTYDVRASLREQEEPETYKYSTLTINKKVVDYSSTNLAALFANAKGAYYWDDGVYAWGGATVRAIPYLGDPAVRAAAANYGKLEIAVNPDNYYTEILSISSDGMPTIKLTVKDAEQVFGGPGSQNYELGKNTSPYSQYNGEYIYILQPAVHLTAPIRELTVNVSDNAAKIYGQSMDLCSAEYTVDGLVNDDSPEDIGLTVTSAQEQVAAGHSYQAKAAVNSGSRYTVAKVNGSIAVVAASVEAPGTPAAGPAEIGQKLQDVTLSGLTFTSSLTGETVSGELTWADPQQEITETTTEAAWVFTPSSENYKPVSGTVTVEATAPTFEPVTPTPEEPDPSPEPEKTPAASPETSQPNVGPTDEPADKPTEDSKQDDEKPDSPFTSPDAGKDEKPADNPSTGQDTEQEKAPATSPETSQPSVEQDKKPADNPSTGQDTEQEKAPATSPETSQPSVEQDKKPADNPSTGQDTEQEKAPAASTETSQPNVGPTNEPTKTPEKTPAASTETSQPSGEQNKKPADSSSTGQDTEQEKTPAASTETSQPSGEQNKKPADSSSTGQDTEQEKAPAASTETSQPSGEQNKKPADNPSTGQDTEPEKAPATSPETSQPSGEQNKKPADNPSTGQDTEPEKAPATSPETSQPSVEQDKKPADNPSTGQDTEPEKAPATSPETSQPSVEQDKKPADSSSTDQDTESEKTPATSPETSQPSVGPTEEQTDKPTDEPTDKPTDNPTAKPTEDPKPTEKPVEQPKVEFTDVVKTEYYADAVAWAVEKGITNGTSDTTFSPKSICTREQVVTFLWRAAGSPEPVSTVNPFTDVHPSDYSYKAVLWAVENKITNGTSATTFSPKAGCKRCEVAMFLWRAEKSPAPARVNPFTDVKADTWYAQAVLWAAQQGITNGTSATTFSPETMCERGQIVTFLYRDFGEK